MGVAVTDPTLLNLLEGTQPNAVQPNQGPSIVTDPNLIAHLEGHAPASYTTPQAPKYDYDTNGNLITLPPMSDQDLAYIKANQSQQPIVHPETAADWQEAAKEAASYAGGQAAQWPHQVASDFNGSTQLVKSGLTDLRSGNDLPSFPSSDPSTWGAGGILKTAAGTAGALTSPINAASEKLVSDPVTQYTGNPVAGQVAGMAASGVLANLAPRLLSAATTPVGSYFVGKVDPATAALAQRAQQFGIPLNASEISDSPSMRFAAGALNTVPFSGAAGFAEKQQGAFNRAVSRTFGEDTDLITPEVMQSAKSRLGGIFNEMANKITIQPDAQLGSDLAQTLNEARSVVTPGEVTPLATQIKNIASVIQQNNGTIPGDAYQALTRTGSPLNKAINGGTNSNVQYYAGQIKGALDDAMIRSASPQDAQTLSDAKLQYKNMKTVENVLQNSSPSGNVSGPGLMSAVRKSYPSMAYSGGGDIGDLARIGQRFMKGPPSSGTTERYILFDALSRLGAGGAALLSGEPTMTAAGVASLPVTMGLGATAARALRSQSLANALINKSLGAPASANPALIRQLLAPSAVAGSALPPQSAP